MSETIGTEVLAWLASVAALVGGAIVRDRQVMKAITDGDKELHARVNDVRDEYVRRDDLDGHLVRLERSMQAIVEGQKETNKRIDELLVSLAGQQRRS